MKIQAINSAMPAINYQQAKQVEFGKKKTSGKTAQEPFIVDQIDIYTFSDSEAAEQKYDIACRLAAYYKTQYESLKNQQNCII